MSTPLKKLIIVYELNFIILLCTIAFFYSCQSKIQEEYSPVECHFIYSNDYYLNRAERLISNFEALKAQVTLDSITIKELSYERKLKYHVLRSKINYTLLRSYPQFSIKSDDSSPSFDLNNTVDSLLYELMLLYQFKNNRIDTFINIVSNYENDITNNTLILAWSYLAISDYFQTEKYNEHIAIKYSEKALSVAEGHPCLIDSYLLALESLINLELVNRDFIKALSYSDKFIKVVSDLNRNHILKAKALSLKGLVLCYLNKSSESEDLLTEAFNLIQKDTCHFEKQEVLKLILFHSNYFRNFNLYAHYIQLLKEEVERCEDYCNLNKIIGVNAMLNKKDKESIKHLQKAYDFVIKKKPLDNPQLGSITYYLYKAYLDEGNYTTALNVYFTESLFPIPKEIQPWDKTKIFSRDKKESTFYFMVMGYYANVFFNKYKSVGNIDDLNFAKELLDSAKLYITNETKINDEDRLLSVFRNSNSIYDLDIQLNYKLYDLTKNFSYVENVFKSSEESKLKILYSLLQLKESTKNKGVKLQKTIDSLIIHERDTEAIINLKDRIDLLKIRHTPQKNELLYHQVSDKLGTDEVVIDYNIIGEEIFIHYLYKDTSLLYQMPYEDEEKTIIDTLISLQKDSTSEQEIINYYAHQAFNLLFPHRILPYQVAIIPDEELLKLSFDLLIDSTSNYLLDNHLISTSGSASQYTSLHQEGSKNIKTVAGFFFSDIPSILTAHRTLKELPANVEEAKNLKEMVPNSLIFSGKNNSRVNFLNALISGRYQVIHLATHGYASEIHAKDIRLYFRDEDYNLDSIYAFNLMDKTVNTDLVILSSCDSGSGLYFHGEGKYDWARYFILAGSKGVITSLWKVDDNASKLIFNTFYALQGQSYMEKLRAAKIRLKSIADYNHPYYWAGFTYST